MTKFGKTILFVILLVVGVVLYVMFSKPNQNVSVEDFITESDSSFVYNEDTENYSIKAAYPKESVAASDAKVFALQEIADFKAFVQETPSEMISFPYSLDISYEEKNGAGITSYVFTTYTYTGGAHGNTYIKTFAYNQEGSRIGFEDILKKGQQNIYTLSRFAQKNLEESLDEGSSLFEDGVPAEVESFENFYIEGSELVFLFQPYQVAAYVLGTLEARVSLADVFGYFKKNTFEGFSDRLSEFRGKVISGEEVRDFMYCEQEDSLWYHDTTGSLQDEYDHAKMSEEPYEEIPVIVEGYIRDVATSVDGEFATLRDGLLVITDLHQVGGGGVCGE